MKNYKEALAKAVDAFNSSPNRKAFSTVRAEEKPEQNFSWELYFQRKNDWHGRKGTYLGFGIFDPLRINIQLVAETTLEEDDLWLFESLFEKALKGVGEIDPTVPFIEIPESKLWTKLKEVIPVEQQQEVFELIWLGLYAIKKTDGATIFVLDEYLEDEKLAPSKFTLEL
ncbi:MAG: hypothetical protein UR69_C0002G0078 [Candidatus Moranbacteria bacterium GW2011_GWE2_35_2-]|nr:MAG: hypothetical protein UR69_C0002G0078 [Candidatus Moranbacteria bacterium GW2011_GWE2_35_2-]KKQ05011.1 MAG: hypothetical protein US15_C0037G0008 [Candidatus Moranbacteria bacterium GW2011_GWF1_36_4]KKQ22573.1 MAG: hypothetical protein US37_C0002G0198 [Candidatus Moranbacteria bacterium GW2011_GWF2_37_11]KKQ28976.1 MAG: hypothetical protein US44_C0004G0020 [Candidatus Moranbacteria bacterium GW2011_GWD1_37_17]KKQ30488.1 MAG: hypothetical protein US47_C0002G0078 [Candidatus Moranbacteria b